MSKTKVRVSEPEVAYGTLHYKGNDRVIALIPQGLRLMTVHLSRAGDFADWEPGDCVLVHFRETSEGPEMIAIENLTLTP